MRPPLCVGDRGGVATILRLRHHDGAEPACNRRDPGVTADDPHGVELGDDDGGEHVSEHRGREGPAFLRPEGGNEPLLGVDEVLHRDREDSTLALPCRHGAAAATTARARATSLARSVMIVSATTARTPRAASAACAALSRVSMTRVESHGA